MMKRALIIVALSVSLIPQIISQTIKEAEALYNKGQYEEAMMVYDRLLQTNRNDYSLKCKAGHCLVDLNKYEKAIPLLKQAAAKRFNVANLYLYEAYFNLYDFDLAIESINKYIKAGGENDSLCEDKISKAYLGKNMLDRIEDVAIIDSFKIHMSNLLSIYELPEDLGMLDWFNLNADTSYTNNISVYYTGRKDKKIFSSFNERGNLDLNVSYKLIDNWNTEKNLSKVLNTPEDENFPFELPDGITLYFASKGHNSLGGYDIFMSRFNVNNNEYSEPVNIGMPFNSPANDYLLVLDEISHVGWFATDRYQHNDTVVVYKFIPNQEKILIKSEDLEYKKLSAQLKVFRKGEIISKTSVSLNTIKKEETDINFLVNDGIVYNRIDQFASIEAKSLYQKLESIQNRLSTLKRLLDGKRKEYEFAGDEEDKDSLRSEVLKMEKEINKYTLIERDYVNQIRRIEINALIKVN